MATTRILDRDGIRTQVIEDIRFGQPPQPGELRGSAVIIQEQHFRDENGVERQVFQRRNNTIFIRQPLDE